jgi:hypothetical protein
VSGFPCQHGKEQDDQDRNRPDHSFNFNFKFHFTVCFSKQSVVTTATYVVTSVEFGATLTNDDAARQYSFATETLNAQAFSF